MKVKNLSALAGLGGALILTASAQAGFVGVTTVQEDAFFNAHPNAGVAGAWAPMANTHDVWRVYAVFDSNTAADRVNALAGTPANPFSMTVASGSLHNYQDGYGAHFNLPGGVNPGAAAIDTYVTINGMPSGGAASLSPGYATEVGNFLGSFSTINAAVFITPDNTQGLAVASAPGQPNAPAGQFRVLLMQVVITEGGVFFGTGSLNVNGQDIGIQYGVPAPGALALLGLAGLVGTRRRRA